MFIWPFPLLIVNEFVVVIEMLMGTQPAGSVQPVF